MSRPALQTPSGAVADSLDHQFGRLRAAVAPAAVVGLAAVWSLVHGIDHRFISFSDGAYMYAAARGVHRLYTDIPLSLPPSTMLGASLVWRLSPHIEAIRIALAGSAAATALLTFRVGRELFRLGPRGAAVAAALALTAPVHAQFVGLDGEALLIPLVLLLALALEARRDLLCALVLGVGFFVKLTWAPYALAALLLARRRAPRVVAGAAAVALALYGGAIAAFGWAPGDLLRQLVVAESRSGYQLGLIPGLALALIVLWWPALALLRPGLRAASPAATQLLAAGAVSALFMLKQGTFFNVVAPLEPLLGCAAVAGAASLWHGRRGGIVALCAAGAALHVASVARGPLGVALPLPLGAAIVNTDNEATVDRLAAVVDAHSTARQRVLVNPYIALVAGRREPDDAADWFILHALGGEWRRVKAAPTAVVGVDSNVTGFDGTFRADTGADELLPLASVDRPPLKLQLYARPQR
jgi:hypothetical protein